MIIGQEILKQLLTYNQETGVFTWLPRPLDGFKRERDCKAWNIRFAGKIAGSPRVDRNGKVYRYIGIFGRIYSAHRLTYLYQTGHFPLDQIDHINGNGTDNSWGNLRAVTPQENQRNQRIHSTNTSGHVGVCLRKQTKKWEAQIKVQEKTIYLGRFSRLADAIAARAAANLKYNFHTNHGQARPL